VRRVLLVGDYPPPWGGLSTQVAALRGRLLALGDDAQVLDIGPHRREPRPECLPARGPVAFARALLRHAARGATIHVHTNGHNPKSWMVAAMGALVGLRAGRRSVVSLGSGLMPAFVRAASPPLRAVVRLTLRAAGAVIVRTEVARAALLACGADPRAVAVLAGFYGVTAAEIGDVPEAVARARHAHRPLIGMISSPGPEYGLALLVDAAARLRPRYPALGVVLLGPDHMDGCPSWIHAPGEVPRAALLAAMATLDVFVRPTYFDGDASSVREALALGVRCVASDTAVRPAGARTFPQGDADALADAIATVLGKPPARAESSSLGALLAIYDALPLNAGARAVERSERCERAGA
jgi:glycosyltransferase involved in cell wall biosynthesis